jgi:hypothetical protein
MTSPPTPGHRRWYIPDCYQHSRLDSRLGNLAYMTVMGYAEE